MVTPLSVTNLPLVDRFEKYLLILHLSSHIKGCYASLSLNIPQPIFFKYKSSLKELQTASDPSCKDGNGILETFSDQ